MTMYTYDAVIVGAGPTGLLAGLALAQSGLNVCILGPKSKQPLGRTTAVLESSLQFARSLGLGETLDAIGEPLRVMRLIDNTDALFRAPEVSFRASEIGLHAFGLNIPNEALTASLEQAAEDRGLTRNSSALTSASFDGDKPVIQLENGETLSASLVVGADGRQSPTRQAAQIGTHGWKLPQIALVLTFEHAKPHHGVSTEFHRQSGPFTQVPLGPNKSSLVWVATPEEAEGLKTLSTSDLESEIEAKLHRTLGRVHITSEPASYPLTTQVARSFAKNRLALVGEAAHAFAPIGAQGLNLGFRDVADLAKAVSRAQQRQQDIGSPQGLAALNRSRAIDVWTRTLGVEALNRSLFSRLPLLSAARCSVLSAANGISPLRRALMAEGLAGTNSLFAKSAFGRT